MFVIDAVGVPISFNPRSPSLGSASTGSVSRQAEQGVSILAPHRWGARHFAFKAFERGEMFQSSLPIAGERVSGISPAHNLF